MTKSETKSLLNKIKGYYNSQFFVDEYVVDAWSETMKPYNLDDSIEHLQHYLKEHPDIPPKPHTFINGLLTPEEKQRIKNSKFTVQCNLCGKWMSLEHYDNHYDKCLDVQYLVNVAKGQGKEIPREDLEQAKPGLINKLMEKYKPKEDIEWMGK